MHEVRRATPADVPRLADAMARAFEHDPLMSWYVPDQATRLERLRRFYAVSTRRMIARGLREVYTTEDVAGEATWAAPGTCRLSPLAMLPALPGMVRAIGFGGLRRSARAYAALQARHPSEPHWYLEGLSTDPDRQGRGVAIALMAPVLERCDRGGVAAWLETQNPANVPFYERRGFEVAGKLDLPGGGPHMWLMVRQPRG